MNSLWNDQVIAQRIQSIPTQQVALEQCVYTSRLLGQDPSLVLHGGGNTSVKVVETNLFGEKEEVLYVKGSGKDLVNIDSAGFAPIRMKPLVQLSQLSALTDSAMIKAMTIHALNPSAPNPSVETILHAVLPYQYVNHTHADAVLAIMNTQDGLQRIQSLYGKTVVIIPYVMPGFDLARLVAEQFPIQMTDSTIGMMLMNHGVFSFGETAQVAYERMVTLVDQAEQYLKRQQAWNVVAVTPSDVAHFSENKREALAHFRNQLSCLVGHPVIASIKKDEWVQAFLAHPQLAICAQQGPVTPDHVIRTKRLPLLGRDLAAYKTQYEAYYNTYAPHAKQPVTMLDPAPRVVLDDDWGLMTIGKTAKEAMIVREIYEHTMETISRSTALGGYCALPAKDIFDVEYWELEQAKLKQAGSAPLFAGEVVLVTGAASGIGAACVAAFLKNGAAVIGLDIQSCITTLHQRADFLGLCCDVTNEQAVQEALEAGVRQFGGLDMLVLNAGIFPKSKNIAELSKDDWRYVMNINTDANLILLKTCYPLLKVAPRKGRVVVIGSKNVPAPGPGAAAYSVSKAAVNQLMRVAALEWGRDAIRINTIHPHAVFDTGIWTEERLVERAASYGMSVEEYKTNNLLQTTITSADIAALAVALCGPLFAKTTAAQIPMDGGNERVI